MFKSKEGYRYGKSNLRGFFNVREDLSLPESTRKHKKSKKGKFYAIRKGRTNNIIVRTWKECERLVKGYSGAIYKSFKTRKEAESFINVRNRKCKPSGLTKADREIIKGCPF